MDIHVDEGRIVYTIDLINDSSEQEMTKLSKKSWQKSDELSSNQEQWTEKKTNWTVTSIEFKQLLLHSFSSSVSGRSPHHRLITRSEMHSNQNSDGFIL